MISIVLSTHAQKKSRTPDSVCQHCKNPSKNSNFIQTEKSKHKHAHMGNATIRHNLFQINLSKSGLTPIKNSNLTNSRNPWTKVNPSLRKQIHIISKQSISSQLQQNSSQKNASPGTPFNVGFGQPQVLWHQRNFHPESLKETPPKQGLAPRIKRSLPQKQIVRCSPPAQLNQQAGKHCKASNQGVQNQQIGSTNFSCSTSTQSNQQKHRNKRAFIQHIKTQNIQTCKSPEKKTFKSHQKPQKSLSMRILSVPTTQNCQRKQSSSQQNHPQTQPIKTKFQIHSKNTIPSPLNPYNLLKGFDGRRKKSRPQSHT